MTRLGMIIYTLSVFGWIACFNLWLFFGREVYEIGTAIVIFGFALTIYLSVYKSFITVFGLFVALNNLMDELFGDPEAINWFEYANASVMLLIFIYKYSQKDDH